MACSRPSAPRLLGFFAFFGGLMEFAKIVNDISLDARRLGLRTAVLAHTVSTRIRVLSLVELLLRPGFLYASPHVVLMLRSGPNVLGDADRLA